MVDNKRISAAGEILEWKNYFYDENGNVVGRMVRDVDGGFGSVVLRSFRDDGQVSHTYEDYSNARLKNTLVHRYDPDGEWQIADRYDITDKKTGGVSTRPSRYTKKNNGEN